MMENGTEVECISVYHKPAVLCDGTIYYLTQEKKYTSEDPWFFGYIVIFVFLVLFAGKAVKMWLAKTVN